MRKYANAERKGTMARENTYDYRAVKGFAISSLFWGVAGLLVGAAAAAVVLALQAPTG